MKYKSPRVRAAYNMFIMALIIAVIVIGIIGILAMTSESVNAENAPGDAQHWQLLADSRVFTPDCDPVKDGER